MAWASITSMRNEFPCQRSSGSSVDTSQCKDLLVGSPCAGPRQEARFALERNARMTARERLHMSGAQSAVAVFDDWEALQAVLIDLEEETPVRTGAVLHARKDVPPELTGLRFLRKMTRLKFAYSPNDLACTSGHLAEELSARLARGARSLANALHGSFSSAQAEQLERHIDKGHL